MMVAVAMSRHRGMLLDSPLCSPYDAYCLGELEHHGKHEVVNELLVAGVICEPQVVLRNLEASVDREASAARS